MTYEETLKYLESFQRFGIRLGLKNIRKLLKLLGNPEKRLKIIHIGGTNGKGSVGAFLFYILKEAGYKVGLYTSPHLIDFRERIRINNRLISKKELTRLVKEVYRLPFTVYGFQPTFFEITTALALKYFADQRVDFAILEVGMGGRLDATNITKPLVSVITNVDFEHTEYLGKSLKKIAYEKCGIIKEGTPVITAENKEEVLRVIEETCRKNRARLYRVGKEIKFRSQMSDLRCQISDVRCQTFNIEGFHDSYENLRISLLGKHQLLNAACAIGTMELLRPKVHPVRGKSPQATASDLYRRTSNGVKITKEEIRKGLAKTTWPGRLEVKRYTVNGKRLTIILDGAHNVAGAKALKKTIKDCFDYKRLILLLGILKSKDIKGIVAQLAPLASRIIITKPQTPRAVEPEEIAEIAKEYSRSLVTKKKISQAIRQATSYAESEDIILITGSLYTVGEAIKVF